MDVLLCVGEMKDDLVQMMNSHKHWTRYWIFFRVSHVYFIPTPIKTHMSLPTFLVLWPPLHKMPIPGSYQ